MKKAISLIIHGPFNEEWLEKIIKQIRNAGFVFEEKVIVSYIQDVENYQNRLKSLNTIDKFTLCGCKDIINPGFFNINRQIKTVLKGLEALKNKDCIVIKLRNDQSVDFRKLYKHLNTLDKEKLITTNCFTRKDRLYHPSDMFLCAHYTTMQQYFTCKPMENTHLGYMLQIQQDFAEQKEKMTALKIVPESYLFRNFLETKKWAIKETQSDSLKALKKYIYLLNTWDIDLKWKNKRTPFFPAGSIILPYTFKMRPFDKAPIEDCKCINKHELNNQTPSIKDLFYMLLSQIIFIISYGNITNKYKYKYKIKYKHNKSKGEI